MLRGHGVELFPRSPFPLQPGHLMAICKRGSHCLRVVKPIELFELEVHKGCGARLRADLLAVLQTFIN